MRKIEKFFEPESKIQEPDFNSLLHHLPYVGVLYLYGLEDEASFDLSTSSQHHVCQTALLTAWFARLLIRLIIL